MAILDGKYEIDAEIGQGVSGSVFQARDSETSKVVVIKRLDPNGPKAEEPAYLSEWEKLSNLEHPHIARALDHQEEGDEKYLIAEYVNGESLQYHLANVGPLTEMECATVFASVAEALATAHDQGVLHLNLKPQNIMLVKDNGITRAKVLDFGLWTVGIDKVPQGNQLAFYKAPEQRRGSGINNTSDIYALGKLLYVSLSGEMNGRISPDAIPSGSPLQEIIYRCIRTNPEDRYQSMHDVVAELKAVESMFGAGGAPQQAPTTAAQPQFKPVSRIPALDGPAGGTPPANPTPANPMPPNPVPPAMADAPQPQSQPQPLGQGLQPGGVSVSDVSATGQIRAASEMQSMIIACKSHLTHKRLRTCREMVNEAQEQLNEYAKIQSPEWVESTDAAIREIEEELLRREQELDQLARTAQEAYDDARFEDVQMAAMAAREICTESTGCDAIEEDAAQHIANIKIFMDDACRGMKYRNYKKAQVACMRTLELNPRHADALRIQKQVHGIMRRRKFGKFLLKASPIFIIVLGIAGAYGYFLYQNTQRISAFERALEQGNGEQAESIARSFQDRPAILKQPMVVKILGGEYTRAIGYLEKRQEARDVVAEMKDARKRIDSEWTDDEIIALDWKKAEELKDRANLLFERGDSEQAKTSAEDAIAVYEQIFLNYCEAKAEKAIEAEEWTTANQWIEKGTSVPELKSEKLASMRPDVLKYLVPELIVSTTVEGRKVPGAAILINGELKGETPTRISMEVGQTYDIKIILPPRNDTYYKPYEEKVEFQEKMAKTITAELPVIPGPKFGDMWIIESLNLNLKPIKDGNFVMGSDQGQLSEKPPHAVFITNPFWMSRYEITRGQYMGVMGKAAEGKPEDKLLPMRNVSWNEAAEFCRELTKREFLKNRLPLEYEYRLPTEAEWEYCSKAGQKEMTGDLGELAWHSGNSDGQAHEVGTKQPNPWGLYDLLGNVSEWCFDGYNTAIYSTRKSPKNPVGPDRSPRVVRGGKATSAPAQCRPFVRSKEAQKNRDPFIGFRVVLAPSIKQEN